MSKSNKIEKPKFIDELEDEYEINDYDFHSEKIRDKNVENQAVRYKEGRGLSLDSCVFKDVVFQECGFKNMDFVDVVFEKCDLSNIQLLDGSIERCEFIDCKLVGARFEGTHMKNVYFKNCLGSYSNFSYSKIQNVKFEECRLEESVFQEVNNKNMIFNECELNSSYFNKTSLKNIDFTTCSIYGLNVEIPDLEGAIVTSMQALDLSSLLKINIK